MNLDCQTCNDRLREIRGCEKPSANPQFDLDGEAIDRCPLKMITRQSCEYIRFYNFFRDGYLPCRGGIREQSMKFMNAIGIIEGVLAKMEKEMEKRGRHS